ncbi:MAG TPA: 16S rRNA (guanine(966)-N(2))-methyltransferase RsmD [Burkholderiaceae bacterium]|nr:16S rRNA (guanine(966)-N(2))-methyltransferase RsmD [Burkholderiaceae bacterium]
MKKHTIRIVGGEYRRTPIPVIDAVGLRPTPDRVRETLFNWLTHLWDGHFDDKNVLDLFAGTGALGFEAASRGVAHVQMVENNPKAVQQMRQLRQRLDIRSIRIHLGDAKQAVQRLQAGHFDLIFFDPPFKKDWADKLLPQLPRLLADNGLIYLESESALTLPPQFSCIRQSQAGRVNFQLIARAAELAKP